jgi:endonuclease YncB( thermonuclease family)
MRISFEVRPHQKILISLEESQHLNRQCGCLSIVLAFAPASAAEEFVAQVIDVSDGDTITVAHDGQQQVIRLNGIDGPEKSHRTSPISSTPARWIRRSWAINKVSCTAIRVVTSTKQC